ncbi:unnamed protein product [Kluyveromyces dobzhanskii CBS 2104]|uniref:WGS project CCBQ000000000 data, contig 00272 n=1 Tax=Kluyveromyces dobzhanskii CBS 2104 TaxID=1427455 RepID=A0A0A8LAX4_9SACH|nr:unnamed protein product [Kluyveromyces dobzhanskii CBS 2104]
MTSSFRSPDIPDGEVRLITCNLLAAQFKWGYDASPNDGYFGMCCGKYLPFAQTVMQCFVDLLQGDEVAAMEEYTTYCNAFAGTSLSVEETLSQFSNATNYMRTGDSRSRSSYDPIMLPTDVLKQNYNFFYYVYYNFRLAFDCSMMVNISVWMIILMLAVQKWFKFPWLRKIRSRFTSTISSTHHTETRLFGWYLTILPTIGETWFLLLFLMINVLVSFLHYPLFSSITGEGKLIFLVKCVANRTGGLAFGLLPLTVLLAGRNNIISWLTGMPYSSMIFYHKWAARLMTIYGFAHGMLWVGYCLWQEAELLARYLKTTPLFGWGFLITALSVVLVVKSSYMWKSKRYELFLTLHIVLAAIFFYGCYKHCEELGWLGWIRLSVALWVLDRVLRFVKILRFGGLRPAWAKVLDSDHEIFQITVPNTGSMPFFPGCYAFLYVWNTNMFWHGHPFSLMQNGTDIVIIIKAKDGMTRQVYETLPKDGSNFPLRVALEGPYGHEAPVNQYQHALLITSGTALPGPISYLQRMSEMAECHFVWIISNERFLNYMRYILEPYLKQKKKACFEVYITRPLHTDVSWVPSNVQIHHGRPNLQEVVHQDLAKWNNSVVISCALPFVDDQVRNYVAKEMQQGTVDYYDELQVW